MGPVEACREPGSLCLLLALPAARRLSLLRIVLVRGLRPGMVPGEFLKRWYLCARCGSFALLDPVTDASRFEYRRYL